MGLRLQSVAPGQGLHWIHQGLRLWARRPLAFVALFLTFLMCVLLLAALVPYLGGLISLALLPMLSLGFMIASRSALADGPVHALQMIEGLRAVDSARRRSQLMLCAGYALCSIAVITVADWVDDGLFTELQRLLATQSQSQGPASTELDTMLADPRLFNGMVVRLGLAALVSVPFWHAPALVHWGGQGALQALFSSSVAVWRARWAFMTYMVGLAGLAMVVALAVTLVALLTGSRQWVGMLTLPLVLAFSALFYVTLWFSFSDSFAADSAEQPAQAEPPQLH